MVFRNHIGRKYVGMRIMMGYFQVFGMAPYTPTRITETKLSKKGNWQTDLPMKFQSSGFCALYNICLVVADSVVVYMALPTAVDKEYPGKTSMTVTLDVVGYLLGITTTLTIWILLAFRRKTVVNMLNRFIKVDIILESINESDIPDSFPFYYLTLIIWNTIIRVIFIVCDCLSSGSCDPKKSYLYYFLFGVPGYFVSIFLIQYTIAIKVIENRFRLINRILDRYGFERSSNLEDRLWLTSELHSNEEKIEKISILRREYANLLKIAKELGKLNSVPILLTLAFECYMFIYAAYYFVTTIFMSATDVNAWLIVNAVTWLSSKLGPIPALAIAVSSVVSEVVTLQIYQFYRDTILIQFLFSFNLIPIRSVKKMIFQIV